MAAAQELRKKKVSEKKKDIILEEIIDVKPIEETRLELKPNYDKYVVFSEDQITIDKFICPVEGCDFRTDQGPGSLRMHMVISADSKSDKRYCPKHELFYNSHSDELTIEGVRYLAQFPMKSHLDTEIKRVKE